MARSHETAGMGHNGHQLSDDDLAALLAHFGQKVRAARTKEEEAALALKAVRKALSGEFRLLNRETGYTRKDFEDLLEKQDMDEASFLEFEAARFKRYSLGGLPVGTQLDMFPAKDTVDDAALAYEDGKRAGLRGDDAAPPGKVAAILHQDWMRGWHDGQAILIMRLNRAKEIIETRGEPDAEAGADLNEEEVDPLDPDVIAKAARKVRAGDFMDRSAPDAETEAPIEESVAA